MAWRGGRSRRRLQDDTGQGLAIQGADEDGLDSVVAVFADGVGAGAGRVDAGGAVALGAVALGEPQDALSAAQPIERALAEQGVDELGAGGSDRHGALATPGGRLQEEVDFLGRQVGRQRAALAGASAVMGRDERVLVEEVDLSP